MPDSDGTATAVHIRATGEIDVSSALLLNDALSAAAAEGYGEIHLDLAEVTFFDCAGLRALEDADGAAPGRLRLVAVGEPVRLVLHLLDQQRRFLVA
ncbi:STAS domain-containing protein [Micromonospora sp. CPCC 205554]|uniref:STAS domain-containing protein n=1 Tax=Micromonospora sp. CPCC 205554 TaxID=3122401 RepID=UPI002FF36650